MDNNSPIAFIDSGVGGLPYLHWVKEKLPLENFLYFADRANFPYGEKSPQEIVPIVLRAVEQLAVVGQPKMLVIACNTASVTSLDSVRKKLNIPVVGVVPAVKPAAELSQKKRIGILATERTVRGKYLKELIANFAPHCYVDRLGAGEIVRFVENDFFNSRGDKKLRIISKAVEQFQKSGVDIVVLGCTHFIYISSLLQEKLGSSIKVIDSRHGVGNQIVKLLEKNNILSTEKKIDLFYNSGEDFIDTSYREFAKMFKLSYRGVLGAK